MRSSLFSRCVAPWALNCHASDSRWRQRSDAVVPSKSDGSDQGWLLRLMRGSIADAGGSRSPRRLKPGTLGWRWRLHSTSASIRVSAVSCTSPAAAANRRVPSAARAAGRISAASALMRSP
jgi:hypothetical protein